MPELTMLGASYKTASIEIREALVRATAKDLLLSSLSNTDEMVLLSTCNRFEVYLVTRTPGKVSGSFLDSIEKVVGPRARSSFYQAGGPEAVGHLFRVAAGLESIVVGEPQILSQVRAAGIGSRKDGTAGAILSPLFDRAYRVGTRIREEYPLDSGEDSLSDLAVETVGRMSKGRYSIMLIGTGKMIRLAARKLERRASRIYVATRRSTPPRGLEGAVVVPYSQIRKAAGKCDVIISATTADRPILKSGDLAGKRKRIVIDLGMPRNVSPDVRNLPNVRLLDLDDLAKVASSYKPSAAVKGAEAAAVEEANEFHDWLVQTRLSSALADLYSWADAVRNEELRRALGKMKLSSQKEERVLDAMGRRIVSKILARPTKFARSKQLHLTEEEKLELLAAVFGAEAKIGD